jgi:hypothetical protein
MWFYFFNVIFFFHIVISFVVLVGTRDDRTSAYKDLGFGFQDLVFGSQDLRHLMLVDRCSVLCLSRHFSLRPVVTDRRTHVTPSLFSASSGHRQTHARNLVTFLCVQWSQTDAHMQPRHFSLRPVVTDRRTDKRLYI